MSREIDFNRSLVELINDVRYGWRQNAVNLGDTTGSGGGHGAPPGGFIGQLPQAQVTGDTSEVRSLHSGSISSLVDNLDRIRYWETVQIATSAPSPTFAGQIWIDGSSGSAINIRNETDTGWITFSSGGGGVPLDASSPQDIGSSAAVGTSGSAAHGDHIHRGVHSISQYAGTFSYGDVVLVPGTGISINQSSGSFTINSASGTVLDGTLPVDVGSSAVVGTSGSAAHGDHTHRGVHSLSAQGNSFIYGDAVLVAGSGVTLSQSSGSVTIAAPAGGVTLDDTSPVDVGSSAVAGTSGSAAHGDHVHRGVHSVSNPGGVFSFGDVVLVPGTGISVEQSSGSFTINSANGTVLDATSPVDVGSSAAVGTSGSAAHGDHIHRGLHAIYSPGNSFAFGDIALVAGSNVTITQSSGSFTIASTGGGGGGGVDLDPSNPADIGSAASVGSSGSASHGDHIHRGLHAVYAPGNSFAFGDIALMAGSNVTITQSSGSFTFDTSGGFGVPGGANTQVQFNDANVFNGSANFTWNNSSNVLTLSDSLLGSLSFNGSRVTGIAADGITLAGGNGSGTAGGSIQLNGGNATGANPGGSVSLSAGDSSSGSGGNIVLSGGDGVVAGNIALLPGASGSIMFRRNTPSIYAVLDLNSLTSINKVFTFPNKSGTFALTSDLTSYTVLDSTTPADVGSSAAVGTSGSAAHGDHIHRGLHAIYTPGSSFAFGDIALVAGSNITVTQSSGSFTITGTGGGGGVALGSASPVDVGSSAVVGTSGSASHEDHIHRGVHSVSTPGGSFAYGDTVLVAGANISITQSSGSFTIANSGGGGSTGGSIEIVISGLGSTISTGIVVDFVVPKAVTITSWTLLADQTGSIVVDLWKGAYSSFPPTVSNSVTGSALPTLTSAAKNTSSTLTGWTTAWSTDDIVRVNVNSATSVTRVTLRLAYS